MTNALYDKGRAAFLNGGIDWTSDTIEAVAVSGSYTVDLVNHQFLTDIPSGDQLSTSSAFSSKVSTNGVAGAANIVFSAVSSTKPPITGIVIFKSTGTGSTSPLIAYINTATGLPCTPNNSDINVVWSSGADLIFSL